MKILKVHQPKNKYILELGRKLPNKADVRIYFALYPTPTIDCNEASVTIDMLPDIALLEIFDFYVHDARKWYTLVHVCRKWRTVVFGSPRRLGLRLQYNASRPASDMLDIWPPLPIAIRVFLANMEDVDNIIAVLEHNDRIYEIEITVLLSLTISQFEKLMEAMQRPFPALTRLDLVSTAPINPGSFLGGSAPHLRTLRFHGILFPGLPKLLLSATDLLLLQLQNIPQTGYFSPEELVTCLSALTRLECLEIGFKSPQSLFDWISQRPPPQTRTLLPILTNMRFKGASDYLEDFVARIDAPLLKELNITFCYERIFDTPQLIEFINRTPKFEAHRDVHMFFSEWEVSIKLPLARETLVLGIECREPEGQLSSLTQVCRSSLPEALVSMVEHLYIQNTSMLPRWHDDVENGRWLELLRPFVAVKSLYISQDFVPRITPAFQELFGERVIEVLPALQTLFLQGTLPSGHVQQTVEQFVAVRQLAGYSIAVSRWKL